MSYQAGGSPGEVDQLLSLPGRIEWVEMTGDGQVQLGFRGDAGRPYVLQASTDLTGWVEIASFTAVDGITTLHDANATLYPRRFYRVGLSP